MRQSATAIPSDASAGPEAPSAQESPAFSTAFQAEFEQLLRWRRDVRAFRPEALPEGLLGRLLDLACLSPSVGFSQPWRFVLVDDADRRQAVRESFSVCNQAALSNYEGEQARLYASLKLEGLHTAPVQLAVFTDMGSTTGHGLGRSTMPETLQHSTVGAVFALWLAARAWNIGVGWVSIIDPVVVARLLDVPEAWSLTAYLCLGRPASVSHTPELVQRGWESRDAEARTVTRR